MANKTDKIANVTGLQPPYNTALGLPNRFSSTLTSANQAMQSASPSLSRTIDLAKQLAYQSNQPPIQNSTIEAAKRLAIQPTQPAEVVEVVKATPYLDILSAYEAKARANFAAQQRELAKQLAASKASTSSNYDSAAAGNYVNYIKQQNALGEQLAAQGIRGGASESALARIGNNYALNQGSTNASRYGALAQLQSAYDTNIANLRAAMEDRILDTGLSLQQAQLQYDDALAQREYERRIREEDVARAERERAEDIARENKQRKEDIARDEKWKKTEYKDTKISKKVEQYAAGLLQYTGDKGIESLRKMRDKLKKKTGWAADPLTYGRVQAINNRIGVIKAEKNK